MSYMRFHRVYERESSRKWNASLKKWISPPFKQLEWHAAMRLHSSVSLIVASNVSRSTGAPVHQNNCLRPHVGLLLQRSENDDENAVPNRHNGLLLEPAFGHPLILGREIGILGMSGFMSRLYQQGSDFLCSFCHSSDCLPFLDFLGTYLFRVQDVWPSEDETARCQSRPEFPP
jgi:hypothetical protein